MTPQLAHLAEEAARVGNYEWDVHTNRTHISPGFRAIYGFDPNSAEVDIPSLIRSIHPDDRSCVEKAINASLAAQETASRCDFRIVRPNGEVRWVETRSVASYDPDGRPMWIAGVTVDITERRAMEDALRKSEERLHRALEAERRRADFEQKLIGIVSHDLRNPIAAISLSAQSMLRHQPPESPLRKRLTNIVNATARIERMIRDLLDFTRARLGAGIPITPQKIDLAALIQQVLEEIRLAHPERSIHLTKTGECIGEWDPDRMAQIVTNLVNNALAYSPRDTSVLVTLVGEEREIQLVVHNQGEPIPEARLSLIFEPLQRGSPTNGREERSIGLGLFIVRSIVEAHGGVITARSDAQEGTSFITRLPKSRGLKQGRS